MNYFKAILFLSLFSLITSCGKDEETTSTTSTLPSQIGTDATE